MSWRRDSDEGSWSFVLELLERGDPAFVDELRRITNGERLGEFAATWDADQRPAARGLLLDYLRRPLNAFRHEALVKRLSKRAEQAGDDEVMAHFLILFDRSIRRVRGSRYRYMSQQVETIEAAESLAAQWRAEGFPTANYYPSGGRISVYASWTEDGYQVPGGTTMWRPPENARSKPHPIDESSRQRLEHCRLFSVPTRNYLRRRAWRYFRKLGKQHPDRYVPGVCTALKLYEDSDVANGLELIDNWGLMHILFHHSPALEANPRGWRLVKGHTLAELAPAPYFERLWKTAPQALLDLLREARCRPVRQWAIFLIRRDHPTLLAGLPLEELFALLSHQATEVVELTIEVLRESPNLDSLGVERWLGLLEKANPQALDLICELMSTRLSAERVTLAELVQLASRRPLPVARLGFTWLRSRRAQTDADCQALLSLVEAEAEPVRPELVRWARGALSESPFFQPEWVLEYLDSVHAEVRAEGWKWLEVEPRARDNTGIWQRLLESPYDDVRQLLVANLEDRVGRRGSMSAEGGPLDPELVRFLWASVLLNIHRGGRVKPLVVRQLVRRVEQQPAEARELLPILAVALRSVRGPEWRAGLTGVVQLAEHNPDLAPVVREVFPELELE